MRPSACNVQYPLKGLSWQILTGSEKTRSKSACSSSTVVRPALTASDACAVLPSSVLRFGAEQRGALTDARSRSSCQGRPPGIIGARKVAARLRADASSARAMLTFTCRITDAVSLIARRVRKRKSFSHSVQLLLLNPAPVHGAANLSAYKTTAVVACQLVQKAEW